MKAKPDTRQKTQIDPELLKQSALSVVPKASNWDSIDRRAIIIGTDLAKSREEHTTLIGAVKQAEFTDKEIQKADTERAKLIQEEVDKINAKELKKSKRWYKRIF